MYVAAKARSSSITRRYVVGGSYQSLVEELARKLGVGEQLILNGNARVNDFKGKQTRIARGKHTFFGGGRGVLYML